MFNPIKDVCAQLMKALEQICSLSDGMESAEQSELYDLYEGMRMDELEHAQILTLKLTELISPEYDDANEDESDESAFLAGELNSELKGKPADVGTDE